MNNQLSTLISNYLQYPNSHNAQDILTNAENMLENIDLESMTLFLDKTSNNQFLKLLDTDEYRNQWAELSFKFIRASNYSLLKLFNSRVELNPDKSLFVEYYSDKFHHKSYKNVDAFTKEIAAALFKLKSYNPKVAIYSENAFDSAAIDLSCLFYDIFVSPLNVSFNEKILSQILNQINVNIFITDTIERTEKLRSLRNNYHLDFDIITINEKIPINNKNEFYLHELISRSNHNEIDSILSKRRIKAINEVCTIMFTSGSTGIPKGISFSNYNLVTKRFARAAALPEVGEDEKLLCYLPLFHTFGRYLEMLGMIYWNGTYHFTASHSKDSLFELFPKVKPTGFISIPLRWMQIYELADEISETENLSHKDALNEITGGELKWGLSAAGYLDPKVFTFFQRNGIELMSGFGMTEGTGGITMTPPKNYKQNSVGKPLPGIYLSFGENNELLIKGHYVARYLEDKGQGDLIPFPDEDDYKLPTGDIFTKNDDGFYEIIDRVKDIYKNNKGQTVAPKNAENKFEGVPGIKRTFLVGDGRPYNILFVIPDNEDEVFMSKPQSTRNEYYHKIINEVNFQLEPYDRAVNFTVLDRDFSAELGELTPKGSYNRKHIEHNFAKEIEELYKHNNTEIPFGDYTIRIPRWFFRDLGILESDIEIDEYGLVINVLNKKLNLKVIDSENNHLKIGNLEYRLFSQTVDLGRVSLDPTFWFANPELINFLPYKENWEVRNRCIMEHVFLPFNRDLLKENDFPFLTRVRQNRLNEANTVACKMLYCDEDTAMESLDELIEMLNFTEERVSNLIRKRIAALARHPSENIRVKAYKLLLLEDPNPDYTRSFPAFIESGLSFLTNDSIKEIAGGKLEKRRLEALRMRMRAYRTQLEWNEDEARFKQFENIFKLLADFARLQPEYYATIRYEFAAWILFDKAKAISQKARDIFKVLSKEYELNLDKDEENNGPEFWAKKLIFDEDIEDFDRNELLEKFSYSGFIKQSVILAHEDLNFKTTDIKDSGVWVSKLDRTTKIKHYRLSITTTDGRHFELQIYLHDKADMQRNLASVYWHIAIAGHPFSARVLPRFGVCRPEDHIRSSVYNGELNIWDKLREFSAQKVAGMNFSRENSLQRLFIEAISTFIKAWNNSERRILPGKLLPENIIVSELDFRDGGVIHSLKNWREFKDVANFIMSIHHNFYLRTIAHYTWCESQIDINWIFDSFSEALGKSEAIKILDEAIEQFDEKNPLELKIQTILKNYLGINRYINYIPIKLYNAIRRFVKWQENNHNASNEAKLENLIELQNLYNLNRNSEYLRYFLFRHTYFNTFSKDVLIVFDRLLYKMDSDSEKSASDFYELSELRDLLLDKFDKKVFNKMVFPELQDTKEFELIVSDKSQNVLVVSELKDSYGVKYNFRPPVNAQEIGQLYRIFFQDKFPKDILESDRFYVATDAQDKVVGGVCYQIQDKDSVFIDRTAVVPKLKDRGIGSAMLEDFCQRSSNNGFKYAKTYYFMQDFYLKRNFRLDKAWGALIRFL